MRLNHRVSTSLLLIGLLGLAVGCASTGGSTRDQGAPVLVPRFHVGWYGTLGDLAAPATAAALGFDLFMPYVGGEDSGSIGRFADVVAVAGSSVVVELPRKLVATGSRSQIELFASHFVGRPEVVGWYLYDEPELHPEARPALLETAYAALKSVTPTLPVYMALIIAPTLGRYKGAMDALWHDYYPIASGSAEFGGLAPELWLGRVKSFSKAANSLGKGIWFVLQGFGEDADGKPQFTRRLPSTRETRFMFYASLLGRPEGLMFWTWYRSDPAWVRDVLSPIVTEFRSSFPLGIEYHAASGFTVSGATTDTILLGDGDGARYLLVVGSNRKQANVRLTASEGLSFSDGNAQSVSRSLEPHGILLERLSSSK